MQTFHAQWVRFQFKKSTFLGSINAKCTNEGLQSQRLGDSFWQNSFFADFFRALLEVRSKHYLFAL